MEQIKGGGWGKGKMREVSAEDKGYVQLEDDVAESDDMDWESSTESAQPMLRYRESEPVPSSPLNPYLPPASHSVPAPMNRSSLQRARRGRDEHSLRRQALESSQAQQLASNSVSARSHSSHPGSDYSELRSTSESDGVVDQKFMQLYNETGDPKYLRLALGGGARAASSRHSDDLHADHASADQSASEQQSRSQSSSATASASATSSSPKKRGRQISAREAGSLQPQTSANTSVELLGPQDPRRVPEPISKHLIPTVYTLAPPTREHLHPSQSVLLYSVHPIEYPKNTVIRATPSSFLLTSPTTHPFEPFFAVDETIVKHTNAIVYRGSILDRSLLRKDGDNGPTHALNKVPRNGIIGAAIGPEEKQLEVFVRRAGSKRVCLKVQHFDVSASLDACQHWIFAHTVWNMSDSMKSPTSSC